MKRIVALFTVLMTFITIFAATTFAAGSGAEKTAEVASPYEDPLMLLAFITLAIMIYLPIRDHN